MARIMNRIKMGYFPTPETVLTMLSHWLENKSGQMWRLLDPCCGTGEAALLAELVGGEHETLGVELGPHRAEEATQVMTAVLNAGWRQTRVEDETVSLLWLNPPYDQDLDGDEKRLEIEFLRTSIPSLVPGGIMIYVVPRHILGYRAAALRIAGHLDDVVIRRFPGDEYERFKQVIVIGRKKKYSTPTKEEIRAVRDMRDADLPQLTVEADRIFEIPPAPETCRFRRVHVSTREQVARAHEIGWPTPLRDALGFREQGDFSPAITPKKGHIAMLMASGLLGTMRLEKNGRNALVKGRVFKKKSTRVEVEDDGDEVYVHTYRPETTVGVLDAAGGVRVIQDTGELTAFMEEYGDEIAERILDNPPLYDLKPIAREWDALKDLGTKRKPLPGQTKAGLLDVQKHATIGLARVMKHRRAALMQGEMGLGKTTISLAAVDLLHAYPAIVVCPPHLVNKWRREAEQVIPGCVTRELSRIGKTASMDHDENDVRQFVEDWNAGLLGEKAIAVVSSTANKLGSGWSGAINYRRVLPPDETDGDGIHLRQGWRDAYAAYKLQRARLMLARDPEKLNVLAEKQRKKLQEAQARPTRMGYAEERARFRRILRIKYHREEFLAEQREKVTQARKVALAEANAYPTCPDCGQYIVVGKDEEHADDKRFDKKPHKCEERISSGGEEVRKCGGILYQFGTTHRRWAIADYISSQANGFFQMLVADEVHTFKGRSERGIAFDRLVKSTRYQLGLTGTLYGGKASDLYLLPFRLGIGNVQAEFDYHNARQWVDLYGVWQEKERKGKGKDTYSTFNATRQVRRTGSEKPGVSPAILHRIIENSIFLSLKDLGIGLPPYQEEVATVEMLPEQKEQYDRMDWDLKERAKEDSRYLSLWLQWSLGRPNSAFRDERIIKNHREDGEIVHVEELRDLPAVVSGDELLPKEEWLTDYCKTEVAAGRKVLVYVRQSGTRDIQPRLKEVLESHGLRADVLTSKVGTRKREAWVKKHEPYLDVLIVNPRLVETGLDLVQFATVVFFEIEYSLFTLWQAMRRVWRLGQQRGVKIVFCAYAGTMEEKALALMGQKMQAAQLLYGDEVGGAIVPEDDGDFLAQLARSVLEDKELPDLQSLFAESAPSTTTSVVGSSTAISPRLQRLMSEMYEAHRPNLSVRRRKPVVVSDAQLALF